MNLGDLITLRDCLSVAHHVPGRLRLRFSLKLLADPRAHRLLEASNAGAKVPGLRGYRLNAPARSVIIEYDPAVINPAKLGEALSTRDATRLAALVEEFKTLTGEGSGCVC